MALLTPIYQFESLYKITEDGRVFSVLKNQWLKPSKDRRGYWRVWLYSKGVRSERSLHRLVASSYLGFQEDMTVNHKDNNKNNNHVSNLEWLSNADNIRHAYEHGFRSNFGHTRGKTYAIPKDDLDSIYAEWLTTSLSLRKLAIKHNVNRATLSAQIRRNYKGVA